MASHSLLFMDAPYAGAPVAFTAFDRRDDRDRNETPHRQTIVVSPQPDAAALDGSFWRQWPQSVLITLAASPDDPQPDLSHIIAATTSAGRLPELAAWVAETAVQAGSHVHLLVTIEQNDASDESDLRAEYQLAQSVLSESAIGLRVLGLHANWEVRFGNIGEEVATLAATTGTGVVALERPRESDNPSDVNRVLTYLRKHGSGLCLLVGPGRERPADGYARP